MHNTACQQCGKIGDVGYDLLCQACRAQNVEDARMIERLIKDGCCERSKQGIAPDTILTTATGKSIGTERCWSTRGRNWVVFAEYVHKHIEEYTVPQFGDYPDDNIESMTAEDCIKYIQKYVERFGRNQRGCEDQLRDMLKIAHFASFAWEKIQRGSASVNREGKNMTGDFAKIVRASNGHQVLVFFEPDPDSDDFAVHYITETAFGNVSIKMTIASEDGALRAVNNFTQGNADVYLNHVKQMLP